MLNIWSEKGNFSLKEWTNKKLSANIPPMLILDNIALLSKQFYHILDAPFNRILILCTTSQIFSMLIKVIINAIKAKKLSFSVMTRYGGMPSSHTAFVTAFIFGSVLDPEIGWRSPFFAIGMIFSAVILIDVIRLRGTIDELNTALGKVIEKDPSLKEEVKLPKKIAHTLPDVIAGIITAFVYTLIFYGLFYSAFNFSFYK